MTERERESDGETRDTETEREREQTTFDVMMFLEQQADQGESM